jgi:hypothetical protein
VSYEDTILGRFRAADVEQTCSPIRQKISKIPLASPTSGFESSALKRVPMLPMLGGPRPPENSVDVRVRVSRGGIIRRIYTLHAGAACIHEKLLRESRTAHISRLCAT